MACRRRSPRKHSILPRPSCRSRPSSSRARRWRPEMKASDLKTKTPDEHKTELLALKREVFNLRFQRASAQLENTARVRAVRRPLARIQTVLRDNSAPAHGETDMPTRNLQGTVDRHPPDTTVGDLVDRRVAHTGHQKFIK